MSKRESFNRQLTYLLLLGFLLVLAIVGLGIAFLRALIGV